MSDREALHQLIDQITQAAHERVDDHRNVEKGDGWREMQWSELFMRLDEEKLEFTADILNRRPDRVRAEGGDVVAFMAMMIDKLETIR